MVLRIVQVNFACMPERDQVGSHTVARHRSGRRTCSASPVTPVTGPDPLPAHADPATCGGVPTERSPTRCHHPMI